MSRWRNIKGYEGLYMVSDCGEIKSLNRTVKFPKGKCAYRVKEKILKHILCKGYHKVNLYKNSKPKIFPVHRLVVIAFIPNTENKPQVNHIDGDKDNNNLSNLEWCTSSENIKHAFDTGLKINATGENSIISKISNNEIEIIRSLAKEKKYTQEYIGRIFGVSRLYVCKVHNGYSRIGG